MNTRERFIRAMNFEPVDRMPMLEWAHWWDQTVDRWKQEGLEIAPVAGLREDQALKVQFGLDLDLQLWVSCLSADTPKEPAHGAGIIRTMEDYERILPTLYPAHPFNPETLKTYRQFQQRGEAIVWFSFDGAFWGPRQLLGIEPHLYAFYDEPELLHRINTDLAQYNMRIFNEMCEYVVPDFMTFGEDMSYNKGPMLSESLFNEFLLPYYQKQIPVLKSRGVKVFVDSDGDVKEMIPWLIRAGFEGILPLERQAGVDLNELRALYPAFLFIGHYDKMVMPRGEAAMRAEFDRLLPVMRTGGTAISVDHQTPPGVSLQNYLIYLKLFREYAESAGTGGPRFS